MIPYDIMECAYEKYVLLSTFGVMNSLIDLIAQQALFSLGISSLI